MKRWIALLFALMLLPTSALAEDTDAWKTAPVITKAYEIASGRLYLEWEGQAPIYQVYLDGESVSSTIVNNSVINVKEGTHAIIVYPVHESRSVDTSIDLGLEAHGFGGNVGLDLAALGLDAKDLVVGTPSATLSIDYSQSSIIDSTPENLSAVTDESERVLLSFADRYHSDAYVVGVKIGKDVNYVRFTRGEAAADALIQQNKTIVTLTLDPAFLEAQECIVPELDTKYTFTVQLRKHAEDLLTGEKVPTVINQSRESSGYQYTPVAAWKNAPAISYASQTADGQITIQWEHEDYDRGCEYAVMKVKKALGIRTGEEELGVTGETSFVINDLMNGDYTLAVVPRLKGEEGLASPESSVSVQNDWVVAPELTCTVTGDKTVQLSWMAAQGVETYHITVSKGNSESLLRFIDMDYSTCSEHDVPAAPGQMTFDFVCDEEIDPATGMKFKFEIYGVRHTASGEEQKTAASSHSLTLGQEQ